jgi:hypothetical protein
MPLFKIGIIYSSGCIIHECLVIEVFVHFFLTGRRDVSHPIKALFGSISYYSIPNYKFQVFYIHWFFFKVGGGVCVEFPPAFYCSYAALGQQIVTEIGKYSFAILSFGKGLQTL